MSIFVITSAAYVDAEMQAEFGKLPPAFLPLGNRRLYMHQHAAIASHAQRVILSLPEGFEVDDTDREHLTQLGIELLFVPNSLTLGQSLVYVINITATAGIGPLSVLHGDTLLKELDLDAVDVVSVDMAVPTEYSWGCVRVNEGKVDVLQPSDANAANAVLSGYFNFKDPMRLVQAITRQGGSFLDGLTDYSESRPLKPLLAKDWFDFGHVGTFHRSRRRVTTQREFNSLSTTVRSVTKSGSQPHKIEAEARWFESLPAPLRLYVPSYLGRREANERIEYSLEYMQLPTLAELFVFGRLTWHAWHKIFDACDEVLGAMAAYPAHVVGEKSVDGGDIYLEKTIKRLEQYARTSNLSLDEPCRINGTLLPSLIEIAESAASVIPALFSDDARLIHGDFCFSNLLYDGRAQLVRMIDPRGVNFNGDFAICGDPRYDVAKLHHSAIGLYDHIIAGNYQMSSAGTLDFSLHLPDNGTVRAVSDVFSSMSFGVMQAADEVTLAISVLLFLSMTPLHGEDPIRQRALLANGLRLFKMLDVKLGN